MFRSVGQRRSHLNALATGAILSLSLVAAPSVVTAQETPQEAVESVFTAMEEWRFDEISQYFCDEQASAAAGLDYGAQISQFFVGVPEEQLQAAIQFSIEGPDVEILSQDESSARVRVTASVATTVDEAVAREIMLDLFASLGQESPPDAMIDSAVQTASSMLAAAAQEIEEEADLVLADGSWKVCSPVGPGADDGAGDDGTGDDAAADATSSVSSDTAAADDSEDADGE